MFASNVYSIVFRDFVHNMLKRSEGNLQVFFEVSLLFRLKLPTYFNSFLSDMASCHVTVC